MFQRSRFSPAGGTILFCVSFLGALALAGSAGAEVASSLINEDDPLPGAGTGHTVSSLSNTAVNYVGGYAVSLNSSDGTTTLSHIWGNASGGPGAIIRTEGTFGSLVQTSFESFYGIADDGSVAYSASGTGGPVGGFDSVWKNDTPVMVEGDPYPHAPDTWWRFGSRPGISGDGIPYFVGGLTFTQGGSTQNYGLFLGMTGAPVFVGGETLPNLPDTLNTASTISFDYRFSELTSHHIGEVRMVGSTASDNAMVVDAEGLVLGGTLVREGNVIPISVGGDGVEAWDNFDYTGITESLEWFFTGDTDAATAMDEIIVKNGMIVHREGGILDGRTLFASIEGAYMNEDGDLAFIWDVEDAVAGDLEALFLNDRLLLLETEAVDFDGDGIIDPGAVVANFTGTSALTVSDRDITGKTNVYFTADIDTAGTTSTTDDIEGFYCIEVQSGPVPVRLSGLAATPDLRSPLVRLRWSTSLEIDHAGFHVYRSSVRNGGYDRLTDELVRGRGEYLYVDERVERSTSYFYKVGAVDFDGRETLYGPVAVTTPGWGMRTVLSPSRPNPFTRRTQIRFSLARESRATLTIHDVTGRLVTTLADDLLPAGDHEYTWDGTVPGGPASAAGVYFYRLQSADFSQTRKVVLISRN